MSNWRTTADLGKCLSSECSLVDVFIRKGDGFKRNHELWRVHLGIEETEFQDFSRTLRFELGSHSLEGLTERFNDKLRSFGIKTVDMTQPIKPHLDLVREFLRNNRNEWSSSSLFSELERAKLIADALTVTQQRTIRICSFPMADEMLKSETIQFLDLRFNFKNRELVTGTTWQDIEQALSGILQKPEYKKRTYFLQLDCTYSVSFIAGKQTNVVSGYTLHPLQKGVAWAPTGRRIQPELMTSFDTIREDGSEIAVVLNFSQSTTDEVRKYIKLNKLNVQKLITISPKAGVGSVSVSDGDEAIAIADAIIRFILHLTQAGNIHAVHLFPAAPNSMLYLLGQRYRLQIPLTIYEYSFNDDIRKYSRGVSYPLDTTKE